MLHIPTVASLFVISPNPILNKNLWEEHLTLLFPYRRQWVSAFLKCPEIEGFMEKIKTADFNLLQDWVQKLVEFGISYNLAMPSLTTWRGALQLNPTETFKLTELAGYLRNDAWSEILELEPIPHFYKIWAFFQQGDYQNCILKAKEFLTDSPQDEVVLYILGKAYFQVHEYLAAVIFLEKALQFGMAETEDTSFLIEKAHRGLEGQAQELPLEYWNDLAEKLIGNKEWQALEKLGVLLENQVRDFPKADLMYYKALCSEYDPKKSISFLTQAIETDPKHYFYTQRGLVYLKLKKKKEAVEDFRTAIRLHEEDDQARQLLESLVNK